MENENLYPVTTKELADKKLRHGEILVRQYLKKAHYPKKQNS